MEDNSGSLPRGVVVEQGLTVMAGEEAAERMAVLGTVVTGLANDQAQYAGEGENIDAQLATGPVRHIPERQRGLKPYQKRIRLDFNVGDKRIDRVLTAGSLGRLQPQIRFLVGVGLLGTARLQEFVKTDQQRASFLLSIVNKGQPAKAKPLSAKRLNILRQESEDQGLVDPSNPDGLRLTEAGMEHLLTDQDLRKKLKSTGPIA